MVKCVPSRSTSNFVSVAGSASSAVVLSMLITLTWS